MTTPIPASTVLDPAIGLAEGRAAAGWRRYQVRHDHEGRAALHGMRQQWASAELRAECRSPGQVADASAEGGRPNDLARAHLAESTECVCGIYATHTRRDLDRSSVFEASASTIDAEVIAWGVLAPFERGVRASDARIVALHATPANLRFTSREALSAIATRYGVPLVLPEPPEQIAERIAWWVLPNGDRMRGDTLAAPPRDLWGGLARQLTALRFRPGAIDEVRRFVERAECVACDRVSIHVHRDRATGSPTLDGDACACDPFVTIDVEGEALIYCPECYEGGDLGWTTCDTCLTAIWLDTAVYPPDWGAEFCPDCVVGAIAEGAADIVAGLDKYTTSDWALFLGDLPREIGESVYEFDPHGVDEDTIGDLARTLSAAEGRPVLPVQDGRFSIRMVRVDEVRS